MEEQEKVGKLVDDDDYVEEEEDEDEDVDDDDEADQGVEKASTRCSSLQAAVIDIDWGAVYIK